MKKRKPTVNDLATHICDDESLLFVPIEKMTLMIASIAIEKHCDTCNMNCGKCVISTAFRKIGDAIKLKGFHASVFTNAAMAAQSEEKTK